MYDNDEVNDDINSNCIEQINDIDTDFAITQMKELTENKIAYRNCMLRIKMCSIYLTLYH